jgi:hypothetical protein
LSEQSNPIKGSPIVPVPMMWTMALEDMTRLLLGAVQDRGSR